LLASQLYNYISNKVLRNADEGKQSFVNQKEAGEYLKNLFFSYGALYPWNELVVKSTGEPLTAKYYAEQFIS
jgi:Zn-dependent M32 family carboxypeptidase